MSEVLNREPNTEERMYLEIMQKINLFLQKCVEESDLDPNKQTLVKLKSSLFSSASLIYQLYDENDMDDAGLDKLLSQCKEWLAGGVKGIKQGAEHARAAQMN